MPVINPETIFSEIIAELEAIKDIYSYSNNNQVYNSFVDLCIEKVLEIKEKHDSENQNNTNE